MDVVTSILPGCVCVETVSLAFDVVITTVVNCI